MTRRAHTSLSTPHTAQVQPLLAKVVSDFQLAQLESRANLETDSAKAQANYLQVSYNTTPLWGVCGMLLSQAVVDSDPEYVVRRFESGRYAVDAQVRQIYQQALNQAQVRTLE